MGEVLEVKTGILESRLKCHAPVVPRFSLNWSVSGRAIAALNIGMRFGKA